MNVYFNSARNTINYTVAPLFKPTAKNALVWGAIILSAAAVYAYKGKQIRASLGCMLRPLKFLFPKHGTGENNKRPPFSPTVPDLSPPHQMEKPVEPKLAKFGPPQPDLFPANISGEELLQIAPGEEISFNNTLLTSILAHWVFESEENFALVKEKLNIWLGGLISRANEGDQQVLEALKTPNYNHEHARNTPLCLLVKMNNLEGVKTLLTICTAEDLLEPTKLGNSILHIACMYGRLDFAMAILSRADELGAVPDLLQAKNLAGYTADDIYSAILNKPQKECFDPAEGFVERYLGYLGEEECRKALIAGGISQIPNASIGLYLRNPTIRWARILVNEKYFLKDVQNDCPCLEFFWKAYKSKQILHIK